MKTILVYALNDDETVEDHAPVLLAAVQIPTANDDRALLSKQQLVSLFDQLEVGSKSTGRAFNRFQLLHLVDAVPMQEQVFRIGAAVYDIDAVKLTSGYWLQPMYTEPLDPQVFDI